MEHRGLHRTAVVSVFSWQPQKRAKLPDAKAVHPWEDATPHWPNVPHKKNSSFSDQGKLLWPTRHKVLGWGGKIETVSGCVVV